MALQKRATHASGITAGTFPGINVTPVPSWRRLHAGSWAAAPCHCALTCPNLTLTMNQTQVQPYIHAARYLICVQQVGTADEDSILASARPCLALRANSVQITAMTLLPTLTLTPSPYERHLGELLQNPAMTQTPTQTRTLARSADSSAEARQASRSAAIAATAWPWTPIWSRHDCSSACSCATTAPCERRQGCRFN